jgi:glycosyltransferase involved in cell wall biosynthesis
VAQRITKYYRRRAQVISPPVDTTFFTPGHVQNEYYLMVTALVPYKGVALAIAAFNALRRPLKIIGSGPMATQLKALAGPCIEFLGWRSNEELRHYYATCRALIFPAQEDFGIVPLEANAAGRPVIALAAGGALETVVPANDPQHLAVLSSEATRRAMATGLFFSEPTPVALQAAVQLFEAHESLFQPEVLRRHAQRFDRALFKQRIHQFLMGVIQRGQRHAQKIPTVF